MAFGGDGAYEHQKLTPATKAQWADMQAGGPTPFGAALTLVGQMLRDETVVPERAFNPALIVVSDGMPTDEWEEPLEELLTLPRGRNALRLAVGVGAGMTSQAYAVLNRFIADESLDVFEANDVNRIASFFRWVTVQVTRRVNSARPNEVDVIPLTSEPSSAADGERRRDRGVAWSQYSTWTASLRWSTSSGRPGRSTARSAKGAKGRCGWRRVVGRR